MLIFAKMQREVSEDVTKQTTFQYFRCYRREGYGSIIIDQIAALLFVDRNDVRLFPLNRDSSARERSVEKYA